MKPLTVAFFDTKSYDREFFDRANATRGYTIKYFNHHLNRDTVDLAAGATVVCAFVNDVLDKGVIESLKRQGVELVAMRCAGYNNVDLKAALGNIHIVRVPEYSPYAVAEHAAALMLTLNRKTHRAYYRTRDGNFSIAGFLGFDMHEKTAGIVGTGKIGKCLAAILKGFGMNILAYDLYPDENYAKSAGIKYVEMEELYRQSDIISLHCPLTPQTQHLINEGSIHKMKDGVMLINTGRGKLIKSQALIDGLKEGKVGAAGLDVYEEESQYFFEDFSASGIDDDILARLLTFPNVLVTSHQGFFTQEAMTNIAETTFQSIHDFFNEEFLKNEICYHCDKKTCRKKEQKRCF